MQTMDPDFAEYVRSRQHQLLRAAFLMCGDRHRAEDLLQEAFTKLALRWPSVRPQTRDAFVRTILYRDAVSAWRRTNREHLSAVGSEPSSTFTADVDAAHDDRVASRVDLWRALAQLAPRQRAVLVLRYFEDRSESEIAQVLDISPGTVKSQAHDGLRRLRAVAPHLAPALIGRDEP